MDTTTTRLQQPRAGARAPRFAARAPYGATDRGAPRAADPRRFARQLKGWSLGVTLVGLGVTWGLVSHNVVGATNATQQVVAAPAVPASGPAAVPSADFFAQPATQPQPILGSGSVQGGSPIVRSGSS